MTSPQRRLYLTIGTAVATLVVMAGVLAGPAVLSCTARGEELLACLRENLVDIGLLPGRQPEVVAVPQAVPAAPPQTEPAGTAQVQPVAPEPGLLRAEPDGSLVIAGTGAPGAEIEVYANGELFGSAKAEASGDWVVVPNRPLAAGGAEITVGIAGGNARSGQSFVVVLDPAGRDEPLVVVATPGEASAILQVPLQAAIPPAAIAQPEPEAAASPEAAEPQPAAQPQPVAAVPPEAVEPELAAPELLAGEVPLRPAMDAELQPAAPALPAAPVTPAIPVAAAPPIAPRIDAIEIDGSANFFAGAGDEGATIRLYVDDTFVADARVEEGRWLVEAQGVLTLPSQRVRIDMLKPGTAEVSARAEVNFVVDLPGRSLEAAPDSEPNLPSARLLDTAADAAAVAAPRRHTATAEDAEPAAAPSRDLAARPALPAVPGPLPPQPAADPSDIELAATPAAPALPEPQAPAAESAAPGPAPQTAIDEEPIPTLRARPVGDPEAMRFASGTAIIRRGDNLWSIARRVYGDGRKYTTIYRANKEQIRRPSRIYPGQVFELPLVYDED